MNGAFCENHGGDFDGWEVAVQPRCHHRSSELRANAYVPFPPLGISKYRGVVDGFDSIDARAEGLESADLIFIFGTRLDAPAQIAADLYRRGLARLVVATGGAGRQPDGLNEAAHHLEMLVGLGVPREAVIVEDRSTTTTENVRFALPLIEARIGAPSSVIAVVKRHHRRALITLARYAPTIERFFVADYQPEAVTRDRLEREVKYIRELTAHGVDLLVADGNGWRRSDA